MTEAAKSFWKRTLVATLIPWAAFMSGYSGFESVADFADAALTQYWLALGPGMVSAVASSVAADRARDFYKWLRWHLG